MSRADEAPQSQTGVRGGLAVHQLRAPPADFVGRREAIEDLRARLGAGGALIAGLTGQGGVGKTALALVLAHELRERYPDAQIDIDLKGASAEPLAPRQVMAEVIRAFEPEAKLPESMDALGRVYRSMLDSRRALLLFDNARDRAQIEPLIPPRGCLMLVTSRQHFTLPGIHTRRLGLLDPDQAVSLVRDVAPRLDEATASKLARLCGYLPLALRVAARSLAEKVTLKPGRYLERLRSAQERLADVDAVLSESLEQIDKAARDLWLRLGVFPGDFDQEAAAAVGAVAPGAAEELLGELARWSLLEWDDKTERYRLHDLARDYARSRLDAAERLDAERQHAEHFLRVAGAANNLYMKGGASIPEGLARFDREWGNIITAQAWAADHAQGDSAAAKVCCDIPLRAAHLLFLRQYPRDSIVWMTAALKSAQCLGQLEDVGKLLGNLGLAYAVVGEVPRAIDYYEQHLSIAREIGDRRGEGTTLGNLGIAYRNLGQVRRAIDYYEQHLTIARELGDRGGEGTTLGNLGIAYRNLGEVHRAIDHHEQQLVIAREIGDRGGEGSALGSLGLAYADLGEIHKAIDYYEQVLTIAREIGDRRREALTCWNLGLAHERLGELHHAIELMQALVDFERELGHPDASRDEARIDQIRARLST